MTLQKNKSTLEWYYKHREAQIKKNREWKLKNRERMLAQKKEYHQKNRDKILKRKKQYCLLNQDKIKEYRERPETKEKQKQYRNNPEAKKRKTTYARARYQNPEIRKKKLEYHKIHSQLPEVKAKKRERNKLYHQIPAVKARRNELARRRNKLNPRSNRSASYDLQDAMNNVRKRDNQTCQWQGCGLTFRQAPIHVHHIFPKSEYPDWELVEQYLICYCGNHHAYWHRMRGDPYHNMIYASLEYMKANPEELLLGGD
jgi:hypothetical protein